MADKVCVGHGGTGDVDEMMDSLREEMDDVAWECEDISGPDGACSYWRIMGPVDEDRLPVALGICIGVKSTLARLRGAGLL